MKSKILLSVIVLLTIALFMAMSYDIGYIKGIERKGKYVKQVKIDTIYKWIPEK